MFLTLLVVFLGFWMYHDPHGFAVSAKALGSGSWDALSSLFTGLIRFFDQMR
ncbi:hypothetical protein H5V45_18160 [Nocardioides sp. KIGAM211]|uniref:Uncharacterized protein n=1 Tax=Nocardioides luti TaxID=2761101 RepID=A0A7X0RJ72_9ACTN|nr:hypothetical protein [Nocardioides luti]MBB6629257.1 hypothetical protein [Nocardioides luti]